MTRPDDAAAGEPPGGGLPPGGGGPPPGDGGPPPGDDGGDGAPAAITRAATPRDAMSSFVTSRPVAVLMVFVAAVVFGYFSYGRLAVTLMPELSYPTVTVRTEYPGAAPEEVENDISRPIEDALGVIGGLAQISSVSRADISDVVLEFAWDTPMSDAVQEVLEKLDLVQLPEDAARPLILRFDPSLDPVLELSLTSAREAAAGEDELRRLRRLAELQIRRALEPIKGVAAVRVRGGLEEEIHVSLDAGALTRVGLSIETVAARLAQENINVAGGTVKEGRTDYMVRTLNEYADAEQIADTVVKIAGQPDAAAADAVELAWTGGGASAAGDAGGAGGPGAAAADGASPGRLIRVRDVGDVSLSYKERQIITRTGGRESVQIDVFKEADANMVALSARIRAALGELPDLPAELLADPPADPAAGAPGDAGARDGPAARPGGHQAGGLARQLHDSEDALLQVVADRSVFIESSIDEVRSTAILGGVLAVLVLFLFLRNLRSTVIIALSIPISLLVTFAPLNVLGVSLNVMSLGGLALGVGMLVDSSIVVLESIYRCREEGDDVVAATVRGTRDVRGAVVASILTTIGVFLPMVFVEGVAGQAFGDLGLAVVFSLLASLVVALFFIPMLASRQWSAAAAPIAPRDLLRLAAWHAAVRDARALPLWLRVLLAPYIALRLVIATALELASKLALGALLAVAWVAARAVWPALVLVMRALWWAPLRLTDALLGAANRVYPRVLGWALDHTGAVLVIVVACLAATYAAASGLDSELLPEVHQGEFTIEVALPVGTPLEETVAILAPVEREIIAQLATEAATATSRETGGKGGAAGAGASGAAGAGASGASGASGAADIESLIVTFGYDATNAQRSDEGEHTARFKVQLASTGDNAAVEDAVAARLRARLAQIPDLEARLVRPVLFSFRTPIEVEVYGDDLPRLRAMAARVERELAALPQLADVETTLRPGAPEVQIVYDRDRLRRYGLNVAEVAGRVRDEVKGREATRLARKERRIPIVVRLDERDRESVEHIRRLIVDPAGTGSIRLASVADVALGEGPSEVRRVDGHRVAVVRANLAQGASLGGATAAIERRLSERVAWPADMSFRVSGQRQEWERSRRSLWLALALSVFLVYVIMAAQFESLVYPLIIMFTIPLAFFGTFVTLHAAGVHLSIVVFLGMIMLAGIVVNNAIVLVDYINILKRRGLGLADAVVTAGRVRLRPILMTTATTVLGLIPMALGLGDGAELRTPLAITVISGLIASTALTLLVIPTLYAAVDRALARLAVRRPDAPARAGQTPP